MLSFENPGVLVILALTVLVGAHILQLLGIHPIMDLWLFVGYYLALVAIDYFDDQRISVVKMSAYLTVVVVVVLTIFQRPDFV